MKEIKLLRKQMKKMEKDLNKKIRTQKHAKKLFKKKDLKSFSLCRAISIIEGPIRAKEEKEKKTNEIKEKIDTILKMNLEEYLEHISIQKNKKTKNTEIEEESVNSLSTEIEENLKVYKR